MEEGAKIVIVAVCALIVGGGGILWVVKASVNSIVRQNKTLVESFIASSTSQVEATNANTEATRALAATLNQSVAVQNERDKSMFRQLDRIERQHGRRNDDSLETT